MQHWIKKQLLEGKTAANILDHIASEAAAMTQDLPGYKSEPGIESFDGPAEQADELRMYAEEAVAAIHEADF